MNKIHISRDRQLLGHFYPEEVAVGLRTGRFHPTDLAWQDPMEAWKPLSEFEDLPKVEVAPEPPPPLPTAEPPPVVVAPPAPPEPAWERGGISGFLHTIGQVFLEPAGTFRQFLPAAPIGRALTYYLLLATTGFWLLLIYNLVFMLLAPGMVPMPEMPAELKPQFGEKVTAWMLVLGCITNMIIAPFFLAGLAFVSSGFLHLLLTLFGVAQPVFAVTIRVFCYAVGTASLFVYIPLCGPLFFVPASVILLIIGLKEAHRTDVARAMAAVMIPAAILGFGYILLGLQYGLR
jgi:hypothetical protein